MYKFRPATDLGFFAFAPRKYGKSTLGSDLLYFPCTGPCEVLVIAGIHGEEADASMVMSRALRLLRSPPQNAAVVLCANPDGFSLAIRGNANNVDLNRNFPSNNWRKDPVQCRMVLEAPRITRLSPGEKPASELEIQYLVDLIRTLAPQQIVSLHSPLNCVDAPFATPLSHRLAAALHLPLVKDIGYETPGSLGSYCEEHDIPCTTIEFPREAPEVLATRYSTILAEILLLQELHESNG